MDGSITLNKKQTISVHLIDSAGNCGGAATAEVDKIDTDAPTISVGNTIIYPSTTYMTIVAGATDAEGTTTSCQSGVYSYSFYDISKAKWSDFQTSASYTMTGLSSGTAYTIKVRAKDKAGNISVEYSREVSTIGEYTIDYSGNSGESYPAQQKATKGNNLTLSTIKPSKSDNIFLGWATSSTATSVNYKAGDTFYSPGSTTSNDTIILYAVWQPETVKLLPEFGGHYQHPEKWKLLTQSAGSAPPGSAGWSSYTAHLETITTGTRAAVRSERKD